LAVASRGNQAHIVQFREPPYTPADQNPMLQELNKRLNGMAIDEGRIAVAAE
jgi:hypothetical protein